MTFCRLNLILVLISLICFSYCIGKCPDSNELLPCTCDELLGEIIVDCSDAENENDLELAFQADFGQNDLSTFKMFQNTGISFVNKNVFGNVTFRIHEVSSTNILYLDTAFFSSSYNTLESISYSDCKFNNEGFPFDDLSKFSSLKELTFSNHKDFTFLIKISSPNLTSIHITDNAITSLQDFCFRDSPQLTFVDLQMNNINDLKSSVFLSANSLKAILLNDNNITDLRSGVFSGLINLKTIELERNPISNIDNAAFNELPALNTISIKNGDLTSLTAETFYNVPNIMDFKLIESQLQFISPNTFLEFTNPGIIVDLRSNNLTILSGSTFRGITQGQINLYANNISTIEIAVFRGIRNSSIELNENLITTLNEEWLRPLLEKNNYVNIIDNPLTCGCDLAWLFDNPDLMGHLISQPTCINGTYLSDLNADYYSINC